MKPRIGSHKPLGDSEWQREEVRYEINRLKGVLLDPNSTDEERAIARSQLEHYAQAGEPGILLHRKGNR